ncbi:hypothetical protein PsorP6_018397 [Peronosclerospora sorghi]|nr:hypothetical protein PsorP6_018380 [Peronosclerospora sorghi]KAI9895585.1 hypothetical protein PsorP6_018397 [Peronosclerospora sorghi]
MLTTREKIIEQARENLKKAQERQKKYYDKKRMANMEFKEGDLVLLSTLPTDDEYQQKFITRWIGPYNIIKKKSDNVVQLGLPPHMKLHSTSNIDNLKRYSANPDKFRT